MLIKPIVIPQEIEFRARPHEATADYFLVAWVNSQFVFGLISALTYSDGRINGMVSFPLALGLENGTKINLRAFPVTDLTPFLLAIAVVDPVGEFILPIPGMNTFILAQIMAENIGSEVYRGQIFVSTKTVQPFNVT